MRLENHKEEHPFGHYVRLFEQTDPAEVTMRLPGVPFDGEAFSLSFLCGNYRITHPEYAIESAEPGEIPSKTAQTFLLRYLLEGRELPWLGEWKTFREMPWGELYEKAFSGRALGRAAFTFGTRLDAFRAACEKLGGEPLSRGDAGYQLRLLGDYRMRILLWAGDEDFPPSAQILYSDNFADGFTAEDRAVAADLLIGAIRSNM